MRVQSSIFEPHASGHLYLQLNQVQACDFFCDGMFNLKAWVGFNENPWQIGRLGVDQKFKCCQALVLAMGGHLQCGLCDLRAQGGGDTRAGCYFDEFLESSLQGAFPVTQTHHISAITEDLNFNMPSPRHQALDIHTFHPKGRTGFRNASGIGRGQVCCFKDGTHAPSTSAPNGLDHHASALLRFKKGLQLLQTHGLVQSRHDRHFATQRQFSGAGFVAK